MAQISEDGGDLESMSYFEISSTLVYPEWFCVEVTLLSKVTNVGGSLKVLSISIDPTWMTR